MTHPVFNLKLKSILPAALSLLLPALCWAGVPSALPNRALKIDLRPQNFKNLSQAADPLSGYRQNPYQGDTRADSLWFNKGMLEEMGQRHEVMAKLREDRQHHFQQTNTDERNYVTEGENMVGNYIKRVFRRRLLSIGDSFKRRFGDGFKDKSKEERIAKNQTEITVTHVAVVSAAVGNGSISKGKIKNKIVVSKQEKKTDEDINIGRAIEAALKDVVRIGRNIVERDQPIEFSDETEARLKFDLPRTTMRVNFNSPVLNADAQYRIGSGTMPLLV